MMKGFKELISSTLQRLGNMFKRKKHAPGIEEPQKDDEEVKVITIYVVPLLLAIALLVGGGRLAWIGYKHHKMEQEKKARKESEKHLLRPQPHFNQPRPQTLAPKPMNKVDTAKHVEKPDTMTKGGEEPDSAQQAPQEEPKKDSVPTRST